MTYFKNVNTLEELRKQYKELLKQYHPDNPQGSTEAAQAINAEYDSLFKVLKDKHSKASDQAENKESYDNMKWNFSEDKKLREMLNSIISFKGITIELIGNWLWAFDSYGYRKELKDLGFKYAPKKLAWYWHSEAFRKKSHKALSIDDIRDYYGSTEIKPDERKQLKQA